MSKTPQILDELLRSWPLDGSQPPVRLARGHDGREVLYLRIDLGILQLETQDRPDGERPGGKASYLDYLQHERDEAPAPDGDEDGFVMTEEHCQEADREFTQYYHRRICWFQLEKYERVVEDADHTLSLMDFCQDHSPSDAWTASHEQFRPFVLYHRTQAAALAALERPGGGAEAAIGEVNAGLQALRDILGDDELEDLDGATLFADDEADDDPDEDDDDESFDNNEFVKRLMHFREEVRREYHVGTTLREQLDQAIQSEDYERAAVLRDQLEQRRASVNSSPGGQH